jgi:hypothetical protein
MYTYSKVCFERELDCVLLQCGHLAGGQIINVCYVHVGNKLIHSRCFSSVWF